MVPALYACSGDVASYRQINCLSRGEEGSARSTLPSRTPLEASMSAKNARPPSLVYLRTSSSRQRIVTQTTPQHRPSRPAGRSISSSHLSYHPPQRAASPASESKTKPFFRLYSKSDRGSSRTVLQHITSTMSLKLRLLQRHPSVQAEDQPSGLKPKNRR